MSVVLFDGVCLAADTIGVTYDGIVDRTEKIMKHTDSLFIAYVGNVTAARHLIYLALENHLTPADHQRIRHYAPVRENSPGLLLVELLVGRVETYNDCSVRIIDTKNKTLWYSSVIEDRVLLIGEELHPFVLGPESIRTLASHLMATDENFYEPTAMGEPAAVDCIHDAIEMSDSKAVANRFAQYPIHAINTLTGEETWIKKRPVKDSDPALEEAQG